MKRRNVLIIAVLFGVAASQVAIGYFSGSLAGASTLESAISRVTDGVSTMLVGEAPGSLDTTFDGDGIVTTQFNPGGSSFADSVAIQADGKIVVAGESDNGPNFEFALARYNTNGSLDTSFDGDGKVTGIDIFARSVAIQSDGKIVVAGDANSVVNGDFGVVRYNTDGSLDTSFDGDGKVTTDIGGGNDGANSVAIQSDGKIVAAGVANESVLGDIGDFAVVRYNTDGSLDTSFDGDGKVITDIGSGGDSALSVTIQTDGKIVAAGVSVIGTNSYFAAVRYNNNGSLDTSFDGDGKVITLIGDYNSAYSMAIQSDGKIVLAGETAAINSTIDIAVVRYNVDGSLDTSFDGDGIVIRAYGPGEDYAYSVNIQSDGKIVLAGETDFQVPTAAPTKVLGVPITFVARLNANGSFDTCFDDDGIVTTNLIDVHGGVGDAAIQSDGKIVVPGGAFDGSGEVFAVARFHGGPCVTAANVAVSGRVTTANGQGIRNARLILTAPDGSRRTATTSTFGYYRFDDLPSGETYVLSVSSKHYMFAHPTRVITLYDEVTDADFEAESPQSK